MEPKDPHNGNSKGERRTGAKVVQLPREWLGPTEDLVPFGVSSDNAPSPGPPSAPSPLPPSAQSFWTEDAASLHAALQGSPPLETPPAAATAKVLRRKVWRPAFNLRAIPTLRLGGIALIAVVALIGNMLGSAHRPTSTQGAAAKAQPVPLAADLGRSAADWQLLARVSTGHELAATHRSVASQTSTGAGRARHPRPHAAITASSSSADQSVVAYHPTTVASLPPAGAQVQAPATPAADPVERQATATSASSPSNPSPASLLGPGHCACG